VGTEAGWPRSTGNVLGCNQKRRQGARGVLPVMPVRIRVGRLAPIYGAIGAAAREPRLDRPLGPLVALRPKRAARA
jgi:hypothetical protein